MYTKNKVICLLFLLTTTFAFGNRSFLTDGEVVTKDVKDTYVYVGKSGGSTSVNLIVDNDVSFTVSDYLFIYQGSSITFRGGNNVTAGTISVRKNSSLYAENSVFNAKFSFMEDGGNMTLKNCTATLTEFHVSDNVRANITLDGTKLTTKKMSGHAGTVGSVDGNYNLTLKNGSSFEVTSAESYGFNVGGNLFIESGSSMKVNSYLVSGCDIVVGSGASLKAGDKIITDKTLTVASDATISASGFNFGKLTITFDEDFTADSDVSFNLEDIFGDQAGMVLSALESGTDFTVSGNNGEFSASIDGGTIHIDTQVIPEPSTMAVIFGIFALGFAVYRKRSK